MILNFNSEHYSKVRNARKTAGLKTFTDIFPENGKQYGHALINKSLTNLKTTYHIESVHRHWLNGWYITLLCYAWYESNETMGTLLKDGKWYGKSHTMIMWENESCVNEIVLKSIKENKNEYKLV